MIPQNQASSCWGERLTPATALVARSHVTAEWSFVVPEGGRHLGPRAFFSTRLRGSRSAERQRRLCRCGYRHRLFRSVPAPGERSQTGDCHLPQISKVPGGRPPADVSPSRHEQQRLLVNWRGACSCSAAFVSHFSRAKRSLPPAAACMLNAKR